MRVWVLFNDNAPRDTVGELDTFKVAWTGWTEDVDRWFAPVGDPIGVPYVLLERIRVYVNMTHDKRGMLPGDVILTPVYAYVYDGDPVIGGFSPIDRDLIEDVPK